VDASGVDDKDAPAAKPLQELGKELSARGILSAVVSASTALIHELRRFGIGVAGGSVGTFPTLRKGIHALERALDDTPVG
jgi:hypothetical protein